MDPKDQPPAEGDPVVEPDSDKVDRQTELINEARDFALNPLLG